MNNPKRLHPISALLKFLRSLRELAIPFVIFFFVGGGEERTFDFYYKIGMLLILLFLLVNGFLTWFRFTYRIEQGELRIEHGVFVRKKRFIPLERIQTIDLSSGIIHRLYGLVKVQVETAGGGNEAEAILPAITLQDAELLRERLLREKSESQTNDEEESNSFNLLPKDLFLMASTSGGIGVVLSAILAFVTQFDEIIPYERFYQYAEKFVKSGFIIVSFSIFVIVFTAWVLSIIRISLKFGNFSLVKKGNDLIITSGLLEKRELSIPQTKVQAVRIQENMVRQLFGYASVFIEVAGGGAEKNEEYSTLLFPIIKKSEVNKHLSLYIPHFSIIEEHLHPLPIRARKRFIFRAIIPAILLSGIISWLLAPYGFFSIILVPIAFLLGVRMFKESGWYLSDDRIKIRYRFLNRHTIFAKRNRIQSFQLLHSPFQKKQSLSTVKFSVKSKLTGKDFALVDMDHEKANDLMNWYSYEKS